MTQKEDFIKRYNHVKESVIKSMDEALARSIGNEVIDFEKCIGNYLDATPLIGAVLQREMRYIIEGSLNDSVTRSQKRKAAQYGRDYRIWHDYAGDYRSKSAKEKEIEL